MLNREEILEQIAIGNIIVYPFNIDNLGSNSLDLAVGGYWYIADDSSLPAFLSDDNRAISSWGKYAKDYWEGPYYTEDAIYVPARGIILAHTNEFVTTKNCVAKMHSRSTIARCGLSVCRCAGLGDVGYIGRWTMEIVNHTNHMIYIKTGMKICQLSFEMVTPLKQQYPGKYGKGPDEWTYEDMLPKF